MASKNETLPKELLLFWDVTLCNFVVGSTKASQIGMDYVFRVEEWLLCNKLHAVASQKTAICLVTEDVNDVTL